MKALRTLQAETKKLREKKGIEDCKLFFGANFSFMNVNFLYECYYNYCVISSVILLTDWTILVDEVEFVPVANVNQGELRNYIFVLFKKKKGEKGVAVATVV